MDDIKESAVPQDAVGIASAGIQICQGFASYYDERQEDEHTEDIVNYSADLARTFALLKELFQHGTLDQEKSARINACLKPCEKDLTQLQQKFLKLRKHENTIPSEYPADLEPEILRDCYPLRASTIMKVKEAIEKLKGDLSVVIQTLQLDYEIVPQEEILSEIVNYVQNAAKISGVLKLSIEYTPDQTSTANDVSDGLTSEQVTRHKKTLTWLSLKRNFGTPPRSAFY